VRSLMNIIKLLTKQKLRKKIRNKNTEPTGSNVRLF
jgi:hypothetical protein